MGLASKLLDRSIVLSFDRTGFRRHARDFATEPERPLPGQVLITGGTQGIGLAAARAVRERGAVPVLWARNADRGATAAAAVGGTFTSVDLGDLTAVRDAAWGVEGPLSGVVLNAGSMPLEKTLSPQGQELMWASQVLGHLLLLRILRERGLLEDCRVVWVASGGLYAARLGQRPERYQRHQWYAAAKRAQVVLNEGLARRWPEVWTAAMHPGWVDTAAVQHSMPVFRAVTRPILRVPAEGADTIVWLLARDTPPPSGAFWFDRKRAPLHLRRSTQDTAAQRSAVVEELFRQSDAYVRSPVPDSP